MCQLLCVCEGMTFESSVTPRLLWDLNQITGFREFTALMLFSAFYCTLNTHYRIISYGTASCADNDCSYRNWCQPVDGMAHCVWQLMAHCVWQLMAHCVWQLMAHCVWQLMAHCVWQLMAHCVWQLKLKLSTLMTDVRVTFPASPQTTLICRQWALAPTSPWRWETWCIVISRTPSSTLY